MSIIKSKNKRKYNKKKHSNKIKQGGVRPFIYAKIDRNWEGKLNKNGDIRNFLLTMNGIEWVPGALGKSNKSKDLTRAERRVIRYRNIIFSGEGNIRKYNRRTDSYDTYKSFVVKDKSTGKQYTFTNKCRAKDKCVNNKQFQIFIDSIRLIETEQRLQKDRLRALKNKRNRLRKARRRLPQIPTVRTIPRRRPKSPRLSPRRSPRLSPRRSPRLSPRLSPRRSPRRSPRLSPRLSPRRSPRLSPKFDINFGITDDEVGALHNLPGVILYGGSISQKKNNRASKNSRKYKKNIQKGGLGPCNPCKECSIVANKPRRSLFSDSEDIKEFALAKDGLRYRTGAGGLGEVHVVKWNNIAPSGTDIRRIFNESDEEVIVIPIIKNGTPKDLIIRLCSRDDCSDVERFVHFKKCLLRLKELKYWVQILNVNIEKFTAIVESEISREQPREKFILKFSKQVDFFKKYRMELIKYAMSSDEERPVIKPRIDRFKAQYQKIVDFNRKSAQRAQDVFNR